MQDMTHEDEQLTVPIWKAHRLTRKRKGIKGPLVPKNWRNAFRAPGAVRIGH